MSALTRQQLLSYALPALPLAIPTVGLYILLPTWYVEQWGLSLGLVAVLLMLARLSDLVSDPFIGHWLDRGSPGRYRRFILLGGILCIPGLWLLVLPLQGLAATSLLLGSVVLYLGWTLVQVPYLSWLAALSGDSHQRARAASWREGLTLAGLLISAVMPALGLMAGLETGSVLLVMALLTLVLGGLALAWLLRSTPLPAVDDAQPVAIRLSSLMRNRPARMLLGSWFFNGVGNGIPAVLFPLFITTTLAGTESDRGLLILIYFGAAVLSLPAWLTLSRHFEKVDLWRAAMTLSILAFLPATLLGAGDLLLFIPICILTGLMLGADLALPHAMQAEVCDWDRFRFRRQQRGLLFACWNAANKLALALAALLGFGLLQLAQWLLTDDQSAQSLALIYAGLPCVFKAIAVVRLRNYPLRQARSAMLHRRLQQIDGVPHVD
jgi:GPH family glycoside/pentoside/hexuronide:cation symporter